MAIRLIDQYPNRAGVPNADYPHGVPRNKSTPTATDGTPFEQAWFRDQEGFFQGLLETAGVTPSGSPDTVEQSDYFDALVSAMHGVVEVNVGGVGDVTLGIYPSRVAALRLTGTLGADVDLIVPDTERLYTVIDETTGGFIVTVRTDAGLGVELANEASLLRSDGADVVRVETYVDADNVSYDNTDSVLTAEQVKAAIDEVVAYLGLDRTWQNVTAQRDPEVTYTNSTGRDIFISVSGDMNNAGDVSLYVDDVFVARAYNADTSAQSGSNVSCIIPNGSTYRVEQAASFAVWAELR